MMKVFRYIGFLGLLIGTQMTGCKQIYVPPSVPLSSSYLVVDGILFSGNDTSVITLSRSRSISDTSKTIYESGDQVSVVGPSGAEYPLTDIGNGQYLIGQLSLDNSQNYQLKVVSKDGNVYISDSVPVRTTPPIDSVYWTQDGAGVHISLNTGDPTNNTRYYRWEYVETWEYQSAFPSFLEYIGNGQTAFRSEENQIYTCYQNALSSDINVVTTNQLSQDVVNQQPIATVPTGSEKISAEYSILVKQYAVTQDAFSFWENLKTNSQNLGTLFDIQPYTQLGNMHCVNNPAIPVIGYTSFCTLQQKRIFINYIAVLPWNYSPYYGSCEDTTYATQLSQIFPDTGPPYANSLIGTTTAGYVFSTTGCVDCTAHGGTTVKPSFMP
jgi:hypothetical protein